MQSNKLEFVNTQLEKIKYECNLFTKFEEDCKKDDRIKIFNYKETLFPKRKTI